MAIHHSFHHFWRTLRRPSVFIFIVIGAIIIFLTFLTTNNALEIAISGLASVFIGIGVNNFTTQETHYSDELIVRQQQAQSRQLLELARHRLKAGRRHLHGKQLDLLEEDLDDLSHMFEMLERQLSTDMKDKWDL